jgi:hypothetical protein
MKQIKSLDDAQKVINDLYNRLELLRTKDWDFKGLKIKNAGDGVDPTDYATLQQVQQPSVSAGVDNDYYTVVFSKDGTVSDGEESPEFVIGKGREGQPLEVWVKCREGFEPAGGDLVINVSWTRYDLSSSPVTVNLLSTDLHLPRDTSNPVFSSAFATPIPKLSRGSVINKVIVTGSNAGYVSVGLVVKVLEQVRP